MVFVEISQELCRVLRLVPEIRVQSYLLGMQIPELNFLNFDWPGKEIQLFHTLPETVVCKLCFPQV